MSASKLFIDPLPDWYRTERAAEKTIEKLNSISELDYYINNPDEFIRRIAILRLKKLGLKGSARVFKEIIDDPVETHANKYIAAWALKSILVETEPDFAINSRYLSSFTGHENYDDLFKIVQGSENDNVNFQFAECPSFSAFNINDEDIVLERDVFFEADFDYKKWLSDCVSGLKTNIIKLIHCVLSLIQAAPVYIWKGMRGFGSHLFQKRRSVIKRVSDELTKQQNRTDSYASIYYYHGNNTYSDTTGSDIFNIRTHINELPSRKTEKRQYKDYSIDFDKLRGRLYRRPGFFTFVKKGVYKLFYILFFPVRFALKHKFAFFCIVASVYLFFTYSTYGRAITTKYAGFDLQSVQRDFFNNAKKYYTLAVNEFNSITGMSEWEINSSLHNTNDDGVTKSSDIASLQGISDMQEDAVLYEVTARDGLNIRIDPDLSADKVGSIPLQYGMTVMYLSIEESDTSGIRWYYVEAEDGRLGWVSSNYLKKAGDQ